MNIDNQRRFWRLQQEGKGNMQTNELLDQIGKHLVIVVHACQGKIDIRRFDQLEDWVKALHLVKGRTYTQSVITDGMLQLDASYEEWEEACRHLSSDYPALVDKILGKIFNYKEHLEDLWDLYQYASEGSDIQRQIKQALMRDSLQSDTCEIWQRILDITPEGTQIHIHAARQVMFLTYTFDDLWGVFEDMPPQELEEDYFNKLLSFVREAEHFEKLALIINNSRLPAFLAKADSFTDSFDKCYEVVCYADLSDGSSIFSKALELAEHIIDWLKLLCIARGEDVIIAIRGKINLLMTTFEASMTVLEYPELEDSNVISLALSRAHELSNGSAQELTRLVRCPHCKGTSTAVALTTKLKELPSIHLSLQDCINLSNELYDLQMINLGDFYSCQIMGRASSLKDCSLVFTQVNSPVLKRFALDRMVQLSSESDDSE